MKKLLIVFLTFLTLAASASDTTYVSVQVGAPAKSANLTLVDSTTGTAITNATISNFVLQNAHPEIISIAASYQSNGTYSIKATPVSQGTGTATITCRVDYTDAGDGLQKTENKTLIIAYTVVYTPPHGARLSLVF